MTSTFNAAPYVDTFSRAEAYLAKGRNKHSRPLVNNTRLTRVNDDSIAVVLHSTAVVTYNRDGAFVIYGGGWNSVTTKGRIRDFSPANPHSDGAGGWIVGHTGEITAPRVQKCRSCKGRGKWMEADYCYGPGWSGPRCEGGTAVYDLPREDAGWWESRRMVPCEHGNADGNSHPTEPCQHGEWKRHSTGQSERTCYRCKGEGRTDYGSNPVPITVTASDAYRVDAAGAFVGLVEKPYTPHHYAPTKHDAYIAAPKQSPAPAHHVGESLVDDLAGVVPNVTATVAHPISGDELRLSTVVIDLNDKRRWTREQIADWLDTLDLDLRFPVGADSTPEGITS